MKNTGIWLDKKQAIIVTLTNDTVHMDKIESGVESFKVHGGSGSKMKGGPQDVIQDSKYLEREKQQLKKYFSRLVEKVESTDALALFGPADTCLKFNRELLANYPKLRQKVKGLIKSDSMTDNQVKALVKEFYNAK